MKMALDKNAALVIGFMFTTVIMVYLSTIPSVGQIAWQYSLTFLLTSFGISFIAVILGAVAALMFLELFKSLEKKDESW
ncbi:MAG: hypothetical protein KGH60_03155 [Candidatus Micrarchaeota archaeon]|nr:hypothetical protein [Candidatus Micrarchaeota archaeon]